MQNNTKITEIKKNLPLGGKSEISKRTGLTQQTVHNILNGKPGRMSNVIKIIKSAESIIKEYREITEFSEK